MTKNNKDFPKSLYTPSDIKSFREHLIKKQKGIDPILKEPFKETVVLDHSHVTQHCRGALNRNCNAFEGLVFNAYKRCLAWLTDVPLSTILRNLADYLEKDYSDNPYHSDWQKRVRIDFKKLPAGKQDGVTIALQEILGKEVKTGKNSKARLEIFNSLVLDRNLGFDIISSVIQKYSQKED